MLLYDVTRPLSPSTPVYPGDPAVDLSPLAQLAWGDAANVSRLTLSSHSGTHIDAPRHFFDQGASIEALDLELLIGPVRVCEMSSRSHLTAADVRQLDLDGVSRILFKTSNSALWQRTEFCADYLALTPEAAQVLIERGVRLVGIDYLSVDAFECDDFPVHRALLSAGVVILEGLDLSAVPAQDYELCALPLLLEDGDGAPARVILRSESSA